MDATLSGVSEGRAIDITIIIPAFNEEKRLPAFLAQVIDYCALSKKAYEIIVVDDGSHDHTSESVIPFQGRFPRLRLVRNKKNRGKGFSVKRAIRLAKGWVCLYLDADGSVGPQEIERNLHYIIDGGFDIVAGSRVLRDSAQVLKTRLHRRLMGAVFNFMVRTILFKGIKDTQCGFKIFKTEAARHLFSIARIKRFGFDIELLYLAYKLGYKIKEVPVSWRHVRGSKVNLASDSLRMIRDIWEVKRHYSEGLAENFEMAQGHQKILKPPIRVLLAIHSAHITGPGRVLLGIAKYLDKREFAVSVLCPEEGALAEDLRKVGVRVIPFCGTGIGKTLRIIGILKKERYHILHIHSGKISFWAKCLGRLLSVPVIVYTEHLSSDSHPWIKSRLLLFIHLLAHRVSNAMADCVIAVSEAARKSFLERQGIVPDKVVTIYNGIDTGEFGVLRPDSNAMREKWNIAKEDLAVGIVARLSPEKGHECFLLAAQEVLKQEPSVKFLIVGEGPHRTRIENLLETLNIKGNVIMTGFVEDVAGLMGIMNVVVQPSLAVTESFGLTVAEAMAMKKPVIVSDIDCFRELIKDGENGILFPSGDYQELAEKILALTRDKALRIRLGDSGYKTVAERFDARMTADTTRVLYQKLLLAKGRKPKGVVGKQITDAFLDALIKERNLSGEKADFYRNALLSYLSFIKDKKLTADDAVSYLASADNFLVETFLQFLEQGKISMDSTPSFNNGIFKEVLQAKAVTARDYDERIKMQTWQFQIDTYYEPKAFDQQKRIAIVLSELKPKRGEKILDVGCGVGTFAYHCAKSGAYAVGMDYSKESLIVAQGLSRHFKLNRNLSYACGDIAMPLPFGDMVFDKVAAIDFIEHIDDTQKRALVAEMGRVLKPQGIMLIFTPNALREKIGEIKSQMNKSLGGYSAETRLHYGLTSRFKFEKILKELNLRFSRKFFDVSRPYLACLPLLNEFLSLNIIWIARKE